MSWGTKDGLEVDGELTAQLPGLTEPVHGSISGRYRSAGAWSLDVEVSPFTGGRLDIGRLFDYYGPKCQSRAASGP